MGVCAQEATKRKKDLENNKENIYRVMDIQKVLEMIKKNNIIKEKISKIYDAVYFCKSIKTLFDNGWDYILFDSFIKRIKLSENEKYFCPISIIGEKYRGKTFILNLLTNNLLRNEIQYKIEGICCKFANIDSEDEENEEDEKDEKANEFSQNNFLFFDMTGKSEPLLIESENEKTLTKEALKKIVETNSKGLKLSENFMKYLLIRNSKILIVVVNELSFSEQLFLYELKNEDNYEQLFVIHNLYKFKQKEDIENYIENTIINSIFFDLTKNYFHDFVESQNEIDEPYYFSEVCFKNGNKLEIIIHLILGNIESEDLWIKNLNEETLYFLKYNLRVQHAKDFFNIDDIIKKELINENIIYKEQNIINSNNIMEDNIIKKDGYLIGKLTLEQNQKYKNNDLLFDNINFYINENIPNYIHYIDKKNSLFIIEIECSGIEDKNISIAARQRNDKIYFYITGKKIYPKELKEIQPDKFYDKPFSINFFVNIENEVISIDISEEIIQKKPAYKNGIYRKEFPMKKIL